MSRIFREKRAALLGIVLLLSSLVPAFAYSAAEDTSKETSTLRQSIQTERQRRRALLDEAKALLQQRSGYIAEDTPYLGTIFYSMAEPNFFSTDNQVVIDVGSNHNMKVGDRLTIFRLLPSVKDHLSGDTFGQRVRVLGEAVAEQVLEMMTVIRITQASYVIEIGDHVEHFGVLPPRITPSPPSPLAKALSAAIVSAKEDKQLLAQGDIVYLDRGAENGVRIGDRFWIFDEVASVYHPAREEKVVPPQQPLGMLRVVDVQESTATALVTKTRHEFGVGARVEFAAYDSESGQDSPRSEQKGTPLPPTTQAPASAGQVAPCLKLARQQIAAAETAGASQQDLAIARNTLAYAEAASDQAQQLKAQGKSEKAAALSETAHADCLTAQQLAQQVGDRIVKNHPASADDYVVQRGNTLWTIAALPSVYRDPLLWPLLYRANRSHVYDPDLLYPNQRLTVPRDYLPEEADVAARRARTRGPWKLGDGPDTYILEGIRR